MAEDKHLTVAELLARNAKEQQGKEKAPRRRRRRSLEDGGVSVAELTGSLPKVDSTPAQSRHSNVDIDETSPVIPAPKAEDAKTEAAPVATAATKAEKPASAPQDPAEEAKQAEREKLAREARKSEEIKRAEFARKAAAAKAAAAEKAAAKAAAAKAAAEKAATEKAAAEKIAAEKAAAEKSAVGNAAAENTAAAPSSSPSADDTAIIDRVPETVEKAGVTQAVIPGATEAPAERTGELEPVGDEPAELEDSQESKLNPVAVLFLALAGVVLGLVVFKGFEILWSSMNRILVAVLAVAVCAMIAGLVHVLRTERDRLSVVLGAVVGLLLTFGPLLLVL